MKQTMPCAVIPATGTGRREFLRNAVMLAGAGITAPLWAAMKYDRKIAMRYFREHVSDHQIMWRRIMQEHPLTRKRGMLYCHSVRIVIQYMTTMLQGEGI